MLWIISKSFGWIDKWMDGWMDEWMDGWMDGWLDLDNVTLYYKYTGVTKLDYVHI